MPSLYVVRYRRERGMRLKQVEGPMVVHANRPRNIFGCLSHVVLYQRSPRYTRSGNTVLLPHPSLCHHDNGLGREYNHNSETAPKLSSTQLFQSTQWENDYNATASLAINENFNLTALQQSEYRFLCQPSPVNSLADDEDGQHSSGTSSSDASPEAEDYRSFSQSSDTDSEDRPTTARRGIVNPNYPGFQHFASQLHSSDSEEDTTSLNNNNNNNEEDDVCVSINQLDSGGFQKTFYDKPKFNIPVDPKRCNFNEEVDSVTKLVNELNVPEVISDLKIEKCLEDFPAMVDTAVLGNEGFKENTNNNKMADAFLSGVKVEEIQKCEDTNRAAEDCEKAASETDDPVVPRKKEKMAINLNVKKVRPQPANVAALQPPANMASRPLSQTRRSVVRDKKRSPPEVLGSFDVYNIETAMPTIDLDAIENHLKAAREEERRFSHKASPPPPLNQLRGLRLFLILQEHCIFHPLLSLPYNVLYGSKNFYLVLQKKKRVYPWCNFITYPPPLLYDTNQNNV
ncbi:identical protein binding [Homalodisca vitripennis]|nr:identical protein binding [Homalodisca vitripennis]